GRCPCLARSPQRAPRSRGAGGRDRCDASREARCAAVGHRPGRCIVRARAPRAGAPPRAAAVPAARERDGAWFGVRARVGAATLNAYFDTSALIKLIIAEDGSDL